MSESPESRKRLRVDEEGGSCTFQEKQNLSPWLQRFMKTEREEIQEEVVEQTPIDDYFVSDFAFRCINTCDQEKKHLILSSESIENSDHNIQRRDGDDFEVVDEKNEDTSSSDNNDDEIVPSAPREKMVFVHNLAYDISEERLRKEVAKFGQVDEINMPLNQEGPHAGKFIGFALIKFETQGAALACVENLNNRMLLGRKVRVRFNEKRTESQKSLSQPTRYFEISDHRKTNPCFLCGFEGHPAESCPDKVCKICLELGHNAQCCRASRPAPTLCTNCGRWGHQWQWCTETDGHEQLSRNARCFTCGERGHLDCSQRHPPKTSDVFCSRCASIGHTQPSCINLKKRRRASEPVPNRSNGESQHQKKKKKKKVKVEKE